MMIDNCPTCNAIGVARDDGSFNCSNGHPSTTWWNIAPNPTYRRAIEIGLLALVLVALAVVIAYVPGVPPFIDLLLGAGVWFAVSTAWRESALAIPPAAWGPVDSPDELPTLAEETTHVG